MANVKNFAGRANSTWMSFISTKRAFLTYRSGYNIFLRAGSYCLYRQRSNCLGMRRIYARKLLDNLSEMDVRAAEWTNTKWDMEYSANALSPHAFIPKASSRPLGMGLPRAAWVKLNRLRSGVGRFCASIYKWGLAPQANCECGASEQTADHIISQCPIHRAPRGMFGLMVLDDETRC